MKKSYLLGLISMLVVGALYTAPAFAAAPQFFTEKPVPAKNPAYLLRSVTSIPIRQPDALEFVLNGPVEFKIKEKGVITKTIVCTEVEFGTTVVSNSPEGEKLPENKLAMPFGVAEGDSCKEGETVVPTYFDTTAGGAVNASLTFRYVGTTVKATVHTLKLSQNFGGTFCTLELNGAEAEVNDVFPFGLEEAPNNLNLQFTNAKLKDTCGETKSEGEFTANFFVETMSTLSDTAWIE
jgi:hypothetical protein